MQGLTQEEFGKITKGLGIRRTTMIFTYICNHLCSLCRTKAFCNPRMRIEEYCPACKQMIEDKLKKYT